MVDRTEDLSRSVITRDGPGARTTELQLTVLHTPDPQLRDAEIALTHAVTIGRRGTEGVEVGIDDPRVSRRHATLRPRPDGSGAEIEDHESRNGCFVDGRRVTRGHVPVESVLRFGDSLFFLGSQPRRRPARALPTVVGRSARLCEALAACEVVAGSDLPVLLLGDTGTGKEVFARAVHDLSGRSGSFVTLNCAAIPRELVESVLFGHARGAFTGAVRDQRGYFAQAEGGTLFLDEIGELMPDLQSKLLRVLENRELTPVGSTTTVKTDVRIVAATNVDLARDVGTGTFRRDLYARLAGAVVRLPALRQRREDIPLLARHFLAAYGVGLPWSAGFADALVAHTWPLNVRELRVAMQRLSLAVGDATELRSSHAVDAIGQALEAEPDARPAESSEDAAERARILEALQRTGWRVSGENGCAKLLGLKPTTLEARMKRLGIHRPR